MADKKFSEFDLISQATNMDINYQIPVRAADSGTLKRVALSVIQLLFGTTTPAVSSIPKTASNSTTLNKDWLPDATTSAKGAVVLSDDYTETSASLVPTSETLYNGLDTKQDDVGITGRSNSYSNTSETIVVSELALKNAVEHVEGQIPTISTKVYKDIQLIPNNTLIADTTASNMGMFICSNEFTSNGKVVTNIKVGAYECASSSGTFTVGVRNIRLNTVVSQSFTIASNTTDFVISTNIVSTVLFKTNDRVEIIVTSTTNSVVYGLAVSIEFDNLVVT